jgi:hypothetical protein
MTRQLHAAVPTSETPGSRLQKTEHSNEGSSSIEFLRSTPYLPIHSKLTLRPFSSISMMWTGLTV